MATNHTTNYQLNLWEPTDKFSREEINENFGKLDAALKALAPVCGSYTTSKTEGVEINLGFRPKFVLLVAANAIGMAADGCSGRVNGSSTFAYYGGVNLQLTEQGFQLSSNTSYFNEPSSSATVWYIAFR